MKISPLLKQAIRAVVPQSLFERMQTVRSRSHQVRFLQSSGLLDQVRHHIESHGSVVQAGPFRGLVYPLDVATVRWVLPKLVGSYESELHPFLDIVSRRSYDCVIDIGSAEGYYAVGLARLLQVPVFAYDPEPRERRCTATFAERNAVSHLVSLHGLFSAHDMARFSQQRALVICDCEGFEAVLFRPDTLALTQNWDLLIELHDDAETSLPALAWPHKTTLVTAGQRSGLQDEHRNAGQQFLWCDSQPH